MTSVAVTGVSGFLGQRLLPRLDVIADRIVGLDMREPARRVPHLDFHLVDVAGVDLKPLLEGVDVVVHLGVIGDPLPDATLMAHVNLDGTRHLLDAASSVGVRKFVTVSSATVYGAWANNAVPLTEDAPLRPNPSFTPAIHAAEIERLLAEFQDDHRGMTITTLRTATTLGPGAQHMGAQLLAGRPSLRVRGAMPPVQFVHVDDVAAALELVITRDLPGVFNVAADGWISTEDARALAPRRYTLPVPAAVAERALGITWATGLGEVPPSVLPYLEHPWVIANDRIKAAGWAPTYTNEEALVSSPPPDPTRRRRVRNGALLAAAVVSAIAIGVAVRRSRTPRGA